MCKLSEGESELIMTRAKLRAKYARYLETAERLLNETRAEGPRSSGTVGGLHHELEKAVLATMVACYREILADLQPHRGGRFILASEQ